MKSIRNREHFSKTPARVIVASSSLAFAKGMLGAVVRPDILVVEAKSADYDAILLVGGVGSKSYWHDETVHSVIREAHQAGKVVSAICLAPVTLANAGLLQGKRASAYPSAKRFLEWKGAIYSPNNSRNVATLAKRSGQLI